MFIGTIVQQQDHIVNLQSTITQLSIESLAAQKRIVAWTVELVNETHTSLQGKINESNARMQNVAHNIQGFTDRNEGSRHDLGTTAETKLTPPAFQAIKVEGDGRILRDACLHNPKMNCSDICIVLNQM